MSRPGARPYGWMLAGALSFATMGVLSKKLSLQTDWRMLALVRSGLMAAFAAALGLATRAPFAFRGSPTLWMRSVVGTLGMFCTFYTLTHLPFSEATTLIKSYPICVAALSWLVLRERPSGKVWTAVGLGVAGIVLITQPHFETSRFPILIGLTNSLATAVVMLGLNRLGHLDSRTIVIHFALVSTAICAAVVVGSGVAVPWDVVRDYRGLGMLVGVGVAGTFGQIAMTRAFATGDPSRVSVVGLTELVFALVFDRVLWGRTFSAATLAGIALVAAPTAWILSSRAGASPGSAPPRESGAAATPR